jgi:hypothetical protein
MSHETSVKLSSKAYFFFFTESIDLNSLLIAKKKPATISFSIAATQSSIAYAQPQKIIT